MGLLSQSTEVLEFHEGNMAAEVAVHTGWSALRSVFRRGFDQVVAQPRFRGDPTRESYSRESPGIHLGGSLPIGCKSALLESAYVDSWACGKQIHCERLTQRAAPRRHGTLVDCWEQLDSVDVKDVMLSRVPMLKGCPHFMRGRLRECFATALRERHRGALIGDSVVQVRAWKLFALIPTMLFQRPRGKGSIGRAELAQRIERLSLLSQTSDCRRSAPTLRATTVEEEQEKRGREAQTKIQMGQVSRARHVLTGASLAPKTDATFDMLQAKRPQEHVREIPREVMDFAKCLKESPSCVGCDIVQADHAPEAGVAQGIFHGILVRHQGKHQEEVEEGLEKEVETGEERTLE